MTIRSRSFAFGGAVAVLAMPTVAQETDEQRPLLEEVIVTANKREENINKVGLTITAIPAEALAERQVKSLEDVAGMIPGLTFTPSTTNTPIFTLRGVGFNESSIGVYPAVSLYVDQAPLPFPVLASHSAFDLERIEVLKGPQGTLFGQNSTGGAINYIAAKPTKTFEAGTSIGYGRFNQVDGDAFISGPINDTLGYRVAVTGLHSDDWQKSYTRRDTSGHSAYVAARGLLDWKASETINVSLNLNGWIDTSQPQAKQLVAIHEQVGGGVSNPARDFYSPPMNGAPSAQLGYPFAPFNPRAADWSSLSLDPNTAVTDPNSGASTLSTARYTNFTPSSDREFYQIAARADFTLPADLTLTSLTSYDHFTQEQGTDGDGMALGAYDLQYSNAYIRSFNQELRLASAVTSDFRWLVGGNFEKSTTFEDQLLRYYANSNYNPSTLFINGSGVEALQDIKNYAGFVSTDYNITPRVTLKAAARYTRSSISADMCSYTTENGNVNKLFNLLGSLNFGGLTPPPAFTPIEPSGCYTLNTLFVPGQPFIDNLTEHNVSWRGGVDFQVTPDALLYFNASRGYKAGSYPALAAASYTSLQPVTQESVTAFEAGVKMQLADNRVGLNAAGFYYDYKDKQVRGKILDTPNIFGILDALVNVPKSRILGAEVDITVRPIDGLTANIAATYLDSKIEEYVGFDIFGGASVGGVKTDFAGEPLPNTSRFSGVLDLEYRMGLVARVQPFIGLTVSTRSKQDAAIGGGETTLPIGPTYRIAPGVGLYPYTIDSYTLIDARLGIEGDDGRWNVMFWGKNITNEYYWTAVVPASDSSSRLAGKPATFGVTFSQKFN